MIRPCTPLTVIAHKNDKWCSIIRDNMFRIANLQMKLSRIKLATTAPLAYFGATASTDLVKHSVALTIHM